MIQKSTSLLLLLWMTIHCYIIEDGETREGVRKKKKKTPFFCFVLFLLLKCKQQLFQFALNNSLSNKIVNTSLFSNKNIYDNNLLSCTTIATLIKNCIKFNEQQRINKQYYDFI